MTETKQKTDPQPSTRFRKTVTGGSHDNVAERKEQMKTKQNSSMSCPMKAMATTMVSVVALLMAVPVTPAAVITSAPFSLGYGAFANVGGHWNTIETAGANTATTLGDFSFTPAPFGPLLSAAGVGFAGRVLGAGTAVDAAHISAPFFVLLTASYNGAAPGDAAAIPDYRLMIEITSLSIYGGVHPSNTGGTDMAWDELTAGHLQTSPSISLLPVGLHTSLASYKHLVWDPADYDTSLALLNDSFTRTFDIIPLGSLWFADGLEIEGRVHLLYNAIPEPTSLTLLGLGGLLALRRHRKH